MGSKSVVVPVDSTFELIYFCCALHFFIGTSLHCQVSVFSCLRTDHIGSIVSALAEIYFFAPVSSFSRFFCAFRTDAVTTDCTSTAIIDAKKWHLGGEHTFSRSFSDKLCTFAGVSFNCRCCCCCCYCLPTVTVTDTLFPTFHFPPPPFCRLQRPVAHEDAQS